MKKTLLISSIVYLLSGCSGTQSLDQVGMCQALVSDMTMLQNINWTGVQKNMGKQTELEVILDFKSSNGDQTGQAQCFYEYTVNDEDARTLANPLLGYSTSPYKMRLNNNAVSNRSLVDAVSQIMINSGKEIANNAAKAIKTAEQKIQSELNR